MADLSTRLADAVVERVPIDWNRAAARARDARESGRVRGLQEIAALCGCRVPGVPAGRAPESPQITAALVALAALAGIIILTAIGLSIAVQLLAPAPAQAPQLAVVLSFAATGAYLAVVGERDARVRQYSIICLLVSAAFSRPLLAGAAEASANAGRVAAIFGGVYPETLLAAVWWRFAQRFPFTYRFTSVDLLSRYAERAATAFGAVAFVVGFAAAHAFVPASPWMAPFLRSSPYGAFWLVFYAFTLPALACIAVRCWGADASERRRVLAFGLALAGGCAPIAAAGILQVASPAYRALDATDALLPRVVDAVVWAGLVSIPVTTSLSIALRRALPVRFLVAGAIRFVLARNALKILSIALLSGIIGHVVRQRNRPLAETLAWMATYPLATGGVLLVLWVSHRRILRIVDAVFGYRTIDHERCAASGVARISSARQRETAAMALLAELRAIYASSQVVVLMCCEQDGWRPIGGCGLPLAEQSSFPYAATLAERGLSVRPGSCTFDLLPMPDQLWVLRARAEMVFAIGGADPWGLLVMGSRSEHMPYDPRDRLLISTLVAAAAHATPRIMGSSADDATCDPCAFECPGCRVVFNVPQPPCGCGKVPVRALLPQRVAGKFQVTARAGAGGMGTVYAAMDLWIKRRVALKLVHVSGPEGASRVLREAQAMATATHPHLAQIYSMELISGVPVLVVEWMPGGTLAERIAVRPLTWRDVLLLGADVAQALSHVHAGGLVHKDVKPSNIAFDARGRAKLLDFGLTAAATAQFCGAPYEALGIEGTSASVSFSIAGTPLYLSPELLDGAPSGHQQDVWALAVTLYESIAGHNPFRADTVHATVRRIRAISVPDIREYSNVVPPEVADFFGRALSRDVARRPPTAADMAAELATLLETRGSFYHEGI